MSEPRGAVQELDLPAEVIQHVVEEWGIEQLFPPQAEAMQTALYGRNLLLAIPTASGKSLVAYLAMVRRLLIDEPGSRAIYIVPLKALASEKVEELRELGDAVGLKVGMAIGDAPREVQKIEEADIIVCTSEKLDSLSRNRPEIIAGISVVVADEVHLVNDSSRGPTMEVNLARLRIQHPSAQIIALSATVGNPEKMAAWLDAELVQSNWRPVALEHATLASKWLEVRHRVSMEEGSVLPPPRELEGPKSHIAWCALNDTIAESAQMLVFVSTRRSAESEARKLSERCKAKVAEDKERVKRLTQLSDEIQKEDSALSDRLSTAIRGGVAFHHAGLSQLQRKAIEDSFRRGDLYCICATPTLAAGVNLPARRVLVRDMKRWADGFNDWISVMEVRQMMGRAGRPKYDSKGESWLVCKGENSLVEADEVAQKYIHGPPEPVVSKLAAEPPLRMHLLSGIATGGLHNRTSIRRFFDATFLSCTQPQSMVDERIDNTLAWLVDEGFIERTGIDDTLLPEEERVAESWDDEIPNWASSALEILDISDYKQLPRKRTEKRVNTPSLGFERADSIETEFIHEEKIGEAFNVTYSATAFGKRVSQLYLDPLSATILRDGLKVAIEKFSLGEDVDPFAILHLVAATPDFMIIWAKMDRDQLHVKTALHSRNLLRDENLEDVLLALTQSAWTLERWMDESTLRDIEKEMKVAPGDLRTRLDLMDWLLYSAGQLLLSEEIGGDQMSEVADVAKLLDSLKQRIRHGCKEELLPLVRIANIGRSRARDMKNLGISSPNDMLNLSSLQRNQLLALRGWGPRVLDRAIRDVKKLK